MTSASPAPLDDGAPPRWDEALLDPATLYIAEQAALAAGLSVEAWLERAIRHRCGSPSAAVAADGPAPPDGAGDAAMADEARPSPWRRRILLAIPPTLAALVGSIALLPPPGPVGGPVAIALPRVPTPAIEAAVTPPAQPANAQPDKAADEAPTDPAQLALWLEPRAKAGDVVAQYRLGALYALGKGVEKDYPRAAALLGEAAKSGLAEAQYDLAILCQAGLGVPRDPEQAADWYLRAATQGHPEAALNLGYAYAKGIGVPRDLTAAAQWFRRAADLGVVNAQYNLAFLYEAGDGVPRSPIEAYAWYSAAASRGDRGAQQAADRLAGGFSAQQLKDARSRAAEIGKAAPKNPG